ncbi:hypothetical protein FB451DRAFT_1402244 [Mycena latifolia]|nr:hypothetical protein FB451DRAFT_1402244 [Mycena latifolia]
MPLAVVVRGRQPAARLHPPPYAHPQAPYAAQHPSYGLGTESQLGSYRSDPASGYPPASPNNSARLLSIAGAPPGAVAPRMYGVGYGGEGRASSKKKRLVALGALAGVVLVAAAVVIPVGGSGGSGNNVVGAVTCADGSSVVMEDEESFVYNNSFGGYYRSCDVPLSYVVFHCPASSILSLTIYVKWQSPQIGIRNCAHVPPRPLDNIHQTQTQTLDWFSFSTAILWSAATGLITTLCLCDYQFQKLSLSERASMPLDAADANADVRPMTMFDR